ncbi:Sfi1-domain-containing protein [Zalerion maritima]|uniref:Sfi1-domain-containing protein n=1 Tax=Zalerion maritima TaxID=339359 RepID=A0AAD5WY32_9PEZI|nr:Sfi1-domain-containing protein [Zalerion maritima]
MQVPDDPDRPSHDGSSSITSDNNDRTRSSKIINRSNSRNNLAGSRIPRRISNTKGANGTRGMQTTARQQGNGTHNHVPTATTTNTSSGEGSSGDGNSALDELDGIDRTRSDSSLLAHVRDWNDHDVGRFYDIILEAERILPSLPGRGQQPTTALFQALEEILQRCGEDPSYDTKFNPIIFKVGVEPGTSLVDKAKKVFDRLGFEVEWVPDDLTENINYYQSLESSQLDHEPPPPDTSSPDDRFPHPSGDPRHVRWRDENANSAGPFKLHDSFTYDRPSSYSGSNTGGTRDGLASPAKSKPNTRGTVEEKEEEEEEDEDDDNSDSFDTYYSEEYPAPRPPPQPPTPTRRPSNGVRAPTLPNDDPSSSFIASPENTDKHQLIQEKQTKSPPKSPRRTRETAHSTLQPSQMGGFKPPATSDENNEPTPGVPPTPQPSEPLKSPIRVHLPPSSPSRPSQNHAQSPRLNSVPTTKTDVPGQATSTAEIPASDLRQLPVPSTNGKHDGIVTFLSPVANGHTTEDNIVNSTTNLTATVPQINMFRAHAEKFRHQSLLRKWRDSAVTTRDARHEQEGEAYRFHSVRLADSALYSWRSITRMQWDRRAHMENVAAQFDGRKLAETTFEVWRDNTAARQHKRLAYEAQQHDTELFFENLEERAERAYNFYIMAKALTHWAVRAQEERNRTETARRHIMRIRYFDSWKEYTAVNELKVRQFVTKKAFAGLKQRLREIQHKNHTAVQVYEGRVVENVLRKWQRLNRGHFVSFTRDMNTKQGAFSFWLQQIRVVKAQRNSSQSQAGQSVLRGFLSAWKDVARVKLEREQTAQEFHDRNLRARVFAQWGGKAELEQMCNRFIAAKNRRLLEEKMVAWHGKAESELKARALNYVKVSREVLLKWTNAQRLKRFQRQVDQRILSDVMYKWFIAGHRNLLLRVHQDRMKIRVLEGFRFSRGVKKDHEQRNDRISSAFHNRQLKVQPFRAWYARLDRLTRMEQQADEFYQYQVKSRVWRMLAHIATDRADQVAASQRLYTWKTWDKLFHKWKTAQGHSYKQKLADAYKTCRRNTKISLARRVLGELNGRAFHRSQQEYVADQLAQHEMQQKARRTLRAWKVRTFQVQSIESYGYNVLQVSVLGKWRQQLTDREMNDARAKEFYRVRRLHSAIRSWALKGLQLRAREHTAFEIQERSNRTIVRKTLVDWYRATMHRIQERGAQQPEQDTARQPPQPPPPGPGPGSGGGGGPGSQFLSNPYSSVQDTPGLRNRAHSGASFRGTSVYLRTPTPGGYSRLGSRHAHAQSQGRGQDQSQPPSRTQSPRDPESQDPIPFRKQSPQKAVGRTSTGILTRQPSGGSYFTHRRGASLPEGRRGLRLGTQRNLGPYPPFDEDEENQPPAEEVELDPLQPDVPTEEEEARQGQQEGSRAPSRAYSRNGASTPTPLRFSTRMPSTTPLAPLPTPFEKQLREQYGNGSSSTETTERPSRPASRTRFPSYSTSQVPVATGLALPGRIVSGGTSDGDIEGPTPVPVAAPNRSSLQVPSNRFRGGLAVNGKRSVGRVRFTGDIRSASDSSTGAVVEGSKEK